MFFFGHIGITTGIVQTVNQTSSRKVDLRAAALFGLLPDLVDKPIGILYKNILGNHTRLWGHSLVFSAAVLSGLLIFFRSRKRGAVILWLCCFGHLLLDRIWIADLPALFWPFDGSPPLVEKPLLEKWLFAIQQPWTIFGEAVGLGILIHFFFKYRLYERGSRRRFFATGLLVVPRNRST